MKSSEMVVIVDTIEEAVKFYTEKLAFDLVDLHINKEDQKQLSFARLRKGKCCIQFRVPLVEELAEFSYIKRCVSRCVCLHAEMKKGIERYFDRCKKKDVKIFTELQTCEEMEAQMFAIRDPFGIKLVFSQPLTGKDTKKQECCGVQLNDGQAIDQMVIRLKSFGILRRFARKLAKAKIKALSKK